MKTGQRKGFLASSLNAQMLILKINILNQQIFPYMWVASHKNISLHITSCLLIFDFAQKAKIKPNLKEGRWLEIDRLVKL